MLRKLITVKFFFLGLSLLAQEGPTYHVRQLEGVWRYMGGDKAMLLHGVKARDDKYDLFKNKKWLSVDLSSPEFPEEVFNETYYGFTNTSPWKDYSVQDYDSIGSFLCWKRIDSDDFGVLSFYGTDGYQLWYATNDYYTWNRLEPEEIPYKLYEFLFRRGISDGRDYIFEYIEKEVDRGCDDDVVLYTSAQGSDIAGSISEGELVEIIARSGAWTHVRSLKTGAVGWAEAPCLE